MKENHSLPGLEGQARADAFFGMLINVVEQHQPYPDRARSMHFAVSSALERQGWLVEREVETTDRGDGRRGFVDLRASKGGVAVGIEIDNKSPRGKSLVKLGNLPCDRRLVVLRNRIPRYSVGQVLVLGVEVMV